MYQSLDDFRISLKIFRDNLKLYLSVLQIIVFMIANIFSIGILGLAILGLLGLLSLGTAFSDDSKILLFLLLIILCFFILMFIFFFSVFNSYIFGLFFKILNSGETNPDIDHNFIYFKKNWSSYFILSIPILVIFFCYQILTIRPLLPFLILIFIDYLSLVFITGLFTSVTAKGSLMKAFKEFFSILRKDFIRIGVSFGIYFTIFRIPFIINLSLMKLGLNTDFALVIHLIAILFTILLGTPILTIVGIQIYRTNQAI